MPNLKSQYFIYTHNNTSIETVGDFIKGAGSVGLGLDINEFLQYTDESDRRNVDEIFEVYDVDEFKKFSSTAGGGLSSFSNADILPFKIGTTVALPFSKVDRQLARLEGNQVINYQTFTAFLASQLDKLHREKTYTKIHESAVKSSGVSKDMCPNITVWLWSRALSSKVSNGKLEYEDAIINITPFISNLQTDVLRDGGMFSFSLPPVVGDLEDGIWKIRNGTLKGNNTNYIGEGSFHKNSELDRSNFYFNRVIQENDVVFIRFETLQLDLNDRLQNQKSFNIDKREIQFKLYDMIGLVDTNILSTSPGSTNVSIEIAGRDLMKLFIEDGVYFYPFDYTPSGIFANESDQERLIRYDGQLKSRFQTSFKVIDGALKFLINALGNIKICSDTLFSDYKNGNSSIHPAYQINGENDRRSKSYVLDSSTLAEKNKRTLGLDTKKKEIEEQIKKYRVIKFKNSQSFKDFNEATSDIEINAAFYDLKEFFLFIKDNKIGTENSTGNIIGWKEFVLNGETIKENSYSVSIEKRLPITGTVTTLRYNISNNVWKFIKEEDSISDLDNNLEQKPLKGIWQIIKLVVDESIHNRRVVSSDLGMDQGSLINAVRKICQEPFVEFFGDTYGDQYYLTVRKPPFDKKGYTGLLNGIINTEFPNINTNEKKRSFVNDTQTSNSLEEFGGGLSQILGSEKGRGVIPIKNESQYVIIDIKEEDIINDNLAYGGQAYSWYKIQPQCTLSGGKKMAFVYLRAVYFKEYADIWGSKPLDIISNYIPYTSIKSKDELFATGVFIEQGMRDMKFMVDSNAYLPFVRRGSIIINPDRRIKRGTLVRLVSTGEIGYVNSVNNSYGISGNQIDRTTTLGLERVMVEKYIENSDISYFNIIDTTLDDNVFRNNTLGVNELVEVTTGRWKVNAEVFNFFLKQKQFG